MPELSSQSQEILKKAMPDLVAFIKDPLNKPLFDSTANSLEEALDEEEKWCSAGVPMWNLLVTALEPLKPPATKEEVRKWASGTSQPVDSLLAMQMVFQLFRKHGVPIPESTRIVRERQLQQLQADPQSFDNVYSDPGLQPVKDQVEPAKVTVPPQPKKKESLGAQVRAKGGGSFMPALATLQQDFGTYPERWAALMLDMWNLIPVNGLKLILEPTKFKFASFSAICQIAEKQAYTQFRDFKWPNPDVQLLLVKQFLGFLLINELHVKTQDPEVFQPRIYLASELLGEQDWVAYTTNVRKRGGPTDPWSMFTPKLIQAWIVGTLKAPVDGPILVILQEELIPLLKARFTEACWP